MQSGATEMLNWLNDLVKTGCANLPSYKEDFWEGISKRMVDGKLNGLSNRVKKIKTIVQGKDDWEEFVLKEISDLNLIAKALLALDNFSKTEQITYLNAAGFNITKKHLQNTPTQSDLWQILAVANWTDDRIKVRQTWLQGVQSKLMGMILEYAWGKQEFMVNWEAGKMFNGEVKLYPSTYPTRLMVHTYQHVDKYVENYSAYPNIDSFLQAYAKAILLNPLLSEFPLCLKNVRLDASSENLFLVDQEAKSMECTCEENIKWALLSVSAGNTIKIFATWNGFQLKPMSALVKNRFVSL